MTSNPWEEERRATKVWKLVRLIQRADFSWTEVADWPDERWTRACSLVGSGPPSATTRSQVLKILENGPHAS